MLKKSISLKPFYGVALIIVGVLALVVNYAFEWEWSNFFSFACVSAVVIGTVAYVSALRRKEKY